MDTPKHASIAELRAQFQAAETQVNQVIVGKPDVVRLTLTCLLAGGHLLLEDLPGVGKTTLAHAVASTFAFEFRRVQLTSDLLPSDLVGVSIYRRDLERFEFTPGPLFTQLLLADELNRGSPKTQSALLEAMAEQQITVDGQTRALPSPFFVIATQNPLEQVGTFALPESQLDRFLMTLNLGYPDAAAERLLLQGLDRRDVVRALRPLLSASEVGALQSHVQSLKVSSALLDYLQRLIAATRSAAEVRFGLSPRAGLALLKATRALAFIEGRDYAIPEDVQRVFVPVAAHRLALREGGADARSVALSLLKRTAVV